MVELLTTYDGMSRATPPLSWLRDPTRPSVQVASGLDRVRRAPAILAALRAVPSMLDTVDDAIRAGHDELSLLGPIGEAIADDRDTLTALAAVHALARVPGPMAEGQLADIISEAAPGFEDHAMWALLRRPASPALVQPLARGVARGSLPGMHAQRVLARWATEISGPVLMALEMALQEATASNARRYLVETMGLVQGRLASASLERIATDPAEAPEVRATAIASYAERTDELLPEAISALAGIEDELARAVRTVRAQRHLARRGPRRDPERQHGIRVAQVHLAASLDPSIDAGIGEAGGVATLLSQLGVALSRQPRLSEVISIGRARPDETQPATEHASALRHEHIPLAPGEGITFSGRWPSVVVAERGVRAALLASHAPDVVHLRMADPGSLAAASVTRELGIPTVFTLAPDPHAPIATSEAAGTLDRTGFALADARGALWYRADLVQRLAREARELVLFPRADLRRSLHELTDIDVHTGPPRTTVVPEGIDIARTDAAAVAVAPAGASSPVLHDLDRFIAELPVERHGLPLIVSVGRMQEAKGMARLIAAFASEHALSDRNNLVIVGGDLEQPTAAEVAELTRIRALFDRHPGLEDKVILLGHRPNQEVATVLAAARSGFGEHIGANGAYACGSLKEEFGLAIIEAMAAGLPVVAPALGGPATYVEEDLTGTLVDTTDRTQLAEGIARALELASEPGTSARTRAVVEGRFTLERMAKTLTAVYRISAGAATLAMPVSDLEEQEEMEVAA